MFFLVFAIFFLGFYPKYGVVAGKRGRSGPSGTPPTHTNTPHTQEDWAVAHKPPTKKCWPWKIRKYPRLIVLVRWYIKQKLFPLLSTLESAASAAEEAIKVIIVDINPLPSKTSRRGMVSFAKLKRQISKCSILQQWLDIQPLMAPVLPPKLEYQYGYGQTDWVLDKLQDDKDWDYIMFTNANNTYSRYLLQATLGARRRGYALIGFDFVMRYILLTNNLTYRYSDLGSMIFHRGTVDRKGKDCSCGLTFQAASKPLGWYNADAGLMQLVQNCTKKSQIKIGQVLFHHK